MTAAVLLEDPNVDDYTKFVKAMQIKDWWKLFDKEEDENEEEDYLVEDDKEDDDDDDDDDEEEEDDDEKNGGEDWEQQQDCKPAATTTATTTADPTDPANMDLTPLDLNDDYMDEDSVFYNELREELGWLEEEDMEAAVATLLQDSKPPSHEDHHHHHLGSPGTPHAEAATAAPWTHHHHRGSAGIGSTSKTHLTAEQYKLMGELMKKHYQLLVQQAVLAIRAAHAQKYQNRILTRVAATIEDDEDDQVKKAKYGSSFWMGHETADEIVECLDGAIGMLQDLNENRKDAFRHFVQSSQDGPGRLTRAQFQKSLKELSRGAARTVFDIPGISDLQDTFELIDKSVQADEDETEEHFLLETESVEDACKFVLDRANAVYDSAIVPGARDLSFNFSDAREYCGEDFVPPCNSTHDLLFRRNRNLFTAGEDNLVLRGVNLYGEKQWVLIADRFLPERSIHIISQRYSKLCMMIYMANGVKIDDEGKLEKPPTVSDFLTDRQKDFLEHLKPMEPPAILNVHRWSLKEDLMLLKAVPILGNSWAKLGTFLIPYRDRGHLRKRYQVLERRVKSTLTRTNRKDFLEALTVRVPTNKVPTPSSKAPPRAPAPADLSSPTKARTPAPFSTPQRTRPGPPQHASPGYPYVPPYSPYPYHPYPPMYSPGYPYPPLPPPQDETSRAAFEKLAQDASKGEWSQLSYMHHMMMSPPHPAHARAQAQAQAQAAEEGTEADTESKNKANERGSLLGSVLGKTETGETEQAPRTPAVKGTVYSTNGTPIGLSETFQASPNGYYGDSQLHGTPGAFGSGTMQSFPATSRLSATEDPSDSQGQASGAAGSNHPENSMDSLATYNSSYTTRARSARPLFGDDLEAVSALNILSNSPALARKSSGDEGEKQPRTKPKSLFATVVGGSGKKKQRKK